ncbi:hypothetical protein [Actinomadura macrotermitis]|uniref:Uncharacterized protein n=1 Tax=Actinomadura macrotermitis TaxID=2585200 RepID=A0A7K0BYF8_9ACTN|nr:hypothetical protein [Actinomadura macrotermitis]MQY06221.1 hypothetical protein [Actinomadura macrotermitis]
MSGWNPPPAPGAPYGYGAAPYGPPPRRSSNGCLIAGLVVGGIVVLSLIVVVVLVVIGLNAKHEISTPSVAGGMTRDTYTETKSTSQISSQRSIIMRTTLYRARNIQSAVYGSGSEKYLFVGGTGTGFDDDTLYSRFRSAVDLEVEGKINTLTLPISDAGGDGKAVCTTIRNPVTSSSSYSSAICAWETGTSIGTVMPVPDGSTLSTSRTWDSTTVAAIMRRIRADVED